MGVFDRWEEELLLLFLVKWCSVRSVVVRGEIDICAKLMLPPVDRRECRREPEWRGSVMVKIPAGLKAREVADCVRWRWSGKVQSFRGSLEKRCWHVMGLAGEVIGITRSTTIHLLSSSNIKEINISIPQDVKTLHF